MYQLEVPLLYLESYTFGLSFATTPHPAASSISKPNPSHESEVAKDHGMIDGLDPRLGREAAVYVGQMKGYRGRLIEINRDYGKIEVPGCRLPTYTTLLKHLVFM